CRFLGALRRLQAIRQRPRMGRFRLRGVPRGEGGSRRRGEGSVTFFSERNATGRGGNSTACLFRAARQSDDSPAREGLKIGALRFTPCAIPTRNRRRSQSRSWVRSSRPRQRQFWPRSLATSRSGDFPPCPREPSPSRFPLVGRSRSPTDC